MADTIASAAHRSLRIALLLLMFGTALALAAQQAYAFPPAGSDAVPVTVNVSLTSRLGQETINFAGIATISRSDPYMNGGVEVVDLELTSLVLNGNSITGPVTITQSATFQSLGEIRSDQAGQDWPASAYLDIFVDISAPASPTDTITKHNEDAIHVVPMFGGSPISISSWPPSAVPWEASLSSCVSFLPIVPKDVCLTSLSLVMSGGPTDGGVGGLAELSRIGDADAAVGSADAATSGTDAGNAWLAPSYVLAASLAATVALLGAAWFARRRLAS